MQKQSTKFQQKTAARKQQIIEAAAVLVLESGVSALSHRKIADRAGVPLGSTTQHFASLAQLKAATLEYLAASVDEEVQKSAQELQTSTDIPKTIAKILTDYLASIKNTHTEAALYVASIEYQELRQLTVRWFEQLTERLAQYMSAEAARAIATFADGILLHAVAYEEVYNEAFIEKTCKKLMELP